MRDNAVNTLAGIFFQVRTREVDGLDVGFPVFRLYRKGELAALDDRQIKLTDLIALGQIRVEVVLRSKTDFSATSAPIARPKRIALSTAPILRTGRAPGNARSM